MWERIKVKWKKWLTQIGKKRREKYLNIQRARLKNHTPTIIANNCIGGFIYRDLDLKYYSPTIDLQARGAGDTVSDRILKQNMEHVVDIIRAAAAKLDAENIEVLLTGGLINAQFDVIEPILREKLGAAYHLELAKQPPIYGALRLAMKEEKSC